MSVTLTGTGGLFTRLGIIFARIRDANLYLAATDISAGGLRSVGVGANNIQAQFASALQYVADGVYGKRDAVRKALDTWKAAMKLLAEQTLIEQVHADAVLTEKDVEHAMRELIRQLIGAGTLYNPDNDVDASTVSATVAALAANTGNGACVASVLLPDGRPNEHVLAEVAEILVTSDAGLGETVRSEPADYAGEHTIADQLAFDWPGGSGATGSIVVVDASLDAVGGFGNLLTNSDFDAFTSNIPDNFTLLVGVAGTDILEEATTVYRSGKSLEFFGDGATLPSIAQTMNTGSGGTTGALEPNTVYALNFWAKDSGAGAEAGVLEVSLVNASNAIISDDAGTENKKQVAVGTLTTSFVAYNGVFVTPKTLPSTYKLRVRLSTALTANESIYVDDLALVKMTPLYDRGPYVAVFAGATAFLRDDKFNVTIANNAAGDFQQYFQRVFDMRTLSLQLPSDTGGGETLADSLVT